MLLDIHFQGCCLQYCDDKHGSVFIMGAIGPMIFQLDEQLKGNKHKRHVFILNI